MPIWSHSFFPAFKERSREFHSRLHSLRYKSPKQLKQPVWLLRENCWVNNTLSANNYTYISENKKNFVILINTLLTYLTEKCQVHKWLCSSVWKKNPHFMGIKKIRQSKTLPMQHWEVRRLRDTRRLWEKLLLWVAAANLQTLILLQRILPKPKIVKINATKKETLRRPLGEIERFPNLRRVSVL